MYRIVWNNSANAARGSKARGSLSVLLEGGTLDIVYRGAIEAEAIVALNRDLERLLANRRDVRRWVIETTETTEFQVAPRESIAHTLRLFREHGGREFIVLTRNPILRMIGAAIRFSRHAPAQIFGSRDELRTASLGPN